MRYHKVGATRMKVLRGVMLTWRVTLSPTDTLNRSGLNKSRCYRLRKAAARFRFGNVDMTKKSRRILFAQRLFIAIADNDLNATSYRFNELGTSVTGENYHLHSIYEFTRH